MVCRNCNRVLADGTSYCLYCGAPLVEDLPETIPVGAPRPEPVKVEFNPVEISAMPYGETVPLVEEPPVVFPEQVPEMPIATAPVESPAVPVNPVPVAAPGTPVSAAPVSSGRNGILEIISKFCLPIAMVAVVALVVAVIFGISNIRLKSELEDAEKARVSTSKEYQEEIDELENTVGQQNRTIDDLKAQLDELEIDADAYNAMVEAMTEHEIGFASHTFQASDRFIVAKKGYTGTKVTLTAHWNKEENAKVYVEHSSDCATVSFDKDTWTKNVTMTVLPKEVGFTVATFSNSVDDLTFSILILVVE